MRILLIADNHLFNDALERVLTENGYELKRMFPAEIDDLSASTNGEPYDLGIIYLNSTPDRQTQNIRRLKKIGCASTLVTIYEPGEEELTKRMLAAGADRCLPAGSAPEELIKSC